MLTDEERKAAEALSVGTGLFLQEVQAVGKACLRLDADLAECIKGYEEALADIADWGMYADDYFKKKWDLDGCISEHKARIDKLKEARP